MQGPAGPVFRNPAGRASVPLTVRRKPEKRKRDYQLSRRAEISVLLKILEDLYTASKAAPYPKNIARAMSRDCPPRSAPSLLCAGAITPCAITTRPVQTVAHAGRRPRPWLTSMRLGVRVRHSPPFSVTSTVSLIQIPSAMEKAGRAGAPADPLSERCGDRHRHRRTLHWPQGSKILTSPIPQDRRCR